MDRAGAVAYIADHYATYIAAVSRDAEDSAGNLASIIDDALWALGYAAADLLTAAPDGDVAEADYKVQLAYRTMMQVTRDLRATSFRISTSGDSFDLGKLSDSAKEELADAKEAVMARFGTTDVVPSDGDTGITTLEMNFLQKPWWAGAMQ